MFFPRTIFLLSIFSFLILLSPKIESSTPPSQNKLEKWFKREQLEPPSNSSNSQLRFISAPYNKPVLHSINTITVTTDSLKTGWIGLIQCYQHLDPVPDMEVTYQYKDMRNLKITQTQNIQQAYIKESSVQLRNVQNNAKLCISAEVQNFYKTSEGNYRLVNGPYHRQFLDSFFPYHLTMNILFPASKIKLVSHKPKQQPGFIVNINPGVISFDSYFTGKLYTEFLFKQIQ